MTQIDFVVIGDQTVRATSLVHDESTDQIKLVAIARGTADGRRLGELLATSPVSVSLPGEEARQMDVAAQHQLTTGEGERVITRYEVTFVPVGSGQAPAASGAAQTTAEVPDQRLDEIERKLNEALALVKAMRHRS